MPLPLNGENKMKPLLPASILFTGIALTLISTCESGDFGKDKHVKRGTVIAVGQCYEGANYTCPVKFTRKDGVYMGEVWGGVMVGQTIYEECWMKDGVSECFSHLLTSPRSMYLNNPQLDIR